ALRLVFAHCCCSSQCCSGFRPASCAHGLATGFSQHRPAFGLFLFMARSAVLPLARSSLCSSTLFFAVYIVGRRQRFPVPHTVRLPRQSSNQAQLGASSPPLQCLQTPCAM